MGFPPLTWAWIWGTAESRSTGAKQQLCSVVAAACLLPRQHPLHPRLALPAPPLPLCRRWWRRNLASFQRRQRRSRAAAAPARTAPAAASGRLRPREGCWRQSRRGRSGGRSTVRRQNCWPRLGSQVGVAGRCLGSAGWQGWLPGLPACWPVRLLRAVAGGQSWLPAPREAVVCVGMAVALPARPSPALLALRTGMLQHNLVFKPSAAEAAATRAAEDAVEAECVGSRRPREQPERLPV